MTSRLLSIGLMFIVFVFWPHKGSALTYLAGSGYIYNDSYLIHIDQDGDNVTGQVWTKDGGWTDAEKIFSDEESFHTNEDYATLGEFSNGSLIIYDRDSQQLVTYSDERGFQHEDLNAYEDVIFGNNKLVVLTCQNETTVQATTWTQSSGFGAPGNLSESGCGEVYMPSFTLHKNVLVEYMNGNAYDVGDGYTILDTIDLTEARIGIQTEDEVVGIEKKKNGDIVFNYGRGDEIGVSDYQYLYAYLHDSATWQPFVAVLNTGDNSGTLYQTSDGKRQFAIGSNADSTQYFFYQWTSAGGWDLAKTYEFSESAELVMPDEIKNPSDFYWAFWFNSSDQLKVYRWTQENQYEKLTTRDLACTQNCLLGLEISMLGKVFVSWRNNPSLSASVWKPSTDIWEDVILVESAGGSINDTHLTSRGQWIIQYSSGQKSLLKRWSPDGSWGNKHAASVDGTYFNGDKLYLVDLNKTTDVLTVGKWNWSTGSTDLTDTIEEISSFNEGNFIFSENLFLSYRTQDDEWVMDTIPL